MTALSSGLRDSKRGLRLLAGPQSTHLDQTAGDVFRMIPETERDTFEKPVAALGKPFKSKDIEELHGIEFYHNMQGNDSIEQLGITVQHLGGLMSFPLDE